LELKKEKRKGKMLPDVMNYTKILRSKTCQVECQYYWDARWHRWKASKLWRCLRKHHELY